MRIKSTVSIARATSAWMAARSAAHRFFRSSLNIQGRIAPPMSLRLTRFGRFRSGWRTGSAPRWCLAALGLGTIMVQFVPNPAVRWLGLWRATKEAAAQSQHCESQYGDANALVICVNSNRHESLLIAAKATHIALYALLVLMPVSGWFMATTTPVRVPTVVFGLFALPYPMAPDLAIYRAAHVAHVALAILLSVLIALHVVAAMVHALIWRDQTLARMWHTQGCFYRGVADRSRAPALLKPARFHRVI